MSSGTTRPLLRHLNVKRELDTLPTAKQRQLKDTFEEISHLREPSNHPNVRALAGHQDLYRARVGTYRGVFDRHCGQIRLLLVGHREDVYRNLEVAERRAMQE